MVVIFDPIEFREWYPKFTPDKVSDIELEQFFKYACQLCDNSEKSPIPIDTRKILLYLLVCHQATIGQWQPGQAGPIGSASQGSVSVSFASGGAMAGTRSSAWYQMTPCGQRYWQLIKSYMYGGEIYTPSNYHPYG